MQLGQVFIIKQEKSYTSCDVGYAIEQHNYLTTSVENTLKIRPVFRDKSHYFLYWKEMTFQGGKFIVYYFPTRKLMSNDYEK